MTDTGVSYIKGESDAMQLLKADKTQFIDSFTKREINNLLNNKADSGISYTKGEVDALQLLNANKTQLKDSYTIIETNNLLNNKANTEVSHTKGEDDALLFAKADKTQLTDSQTKTETDYLISQIDTDNVDLSNYYNQPETNSLLEDKADISALNNYVTLSTSQTKTANKTFNNACRFISSIDGMSTVNGSSFIKSDASDTIVLFGAGSTKPISEFGSTPTDLSNYYSKGRLKYESPFGGTYDETQDPVAKTYLIMSEAEAKLSSKMDSSALGNLVNTIKDQTVNSTKTFNANVNATGFVKTIKDDTSVLFA
ncbi:MAG: hypothetical protein EZS28_029443 [Streblomastix strix]|uniref:Uncharacterized protein n=1 Tax=Streblomastix strix TaxID=222440 RepID=A0A5J4UX28_9EUKA|nr:MAG: hypothetical protein EZS28_029443 [Streblomastix strix]